jgi:hypothetical protein
MKRCWNETGKEKPKYWEKNLSQCHFVQKTTQGLDWIWIWTWPSAMKEN